MRACRVLLTGVLALLVLAGCGSYDAQVTAPGGADGLAGDMAIRDARITAIPPRDGPEAYPAGSAAVVTLTAVNTGDAPDLLLAVSSPVARGSEGLTYQEIPAGFTMFTGAATAPVDSEVFMPIRLTGLREPLRFGLTYPVTFLFERGGAVTLQLPVENLPVPETTPAVPMN